MLVFLCGTPFVQQTINLDEQCRLLDLKIMGTAEILDIEALRKSNKSAHAINKIIIAKLKKNTCTLFIYDPVGNLKPVARQSIISKLKSEIPDTTVHAIWMEAEGAREQCLYQHELLYAGEKKITIC